uniref:CUB domain-containing protein n=1 Tax=Panagrolaimus sp. PS1159 TaxID=55785 RepID=A0AC35FMZ8_9BILA
MLIDEKQFYSCFITFALKEQSRTNYRVIFGYVSNQYTPDPHEIGSSVTSYIIGINKGFVFPDIDDYENPSRHFSQKGYVIFDDGKEKCPLESICNPFVFKDETQIINFGSHPLYNLTNSCRWKFIAPNEYGFKIVIYKFNPKTEVSITNSTDIIVNQRSVKLNHPYYNDDNSIQIYWLNSLMKFTANDFSISISIVKKSFNYTDENCTITDVDDVKKHWKSFTYPYKGFPNNARCFYNLTIPANTSVGMIIYTWGIETNADILQYYRSETDIVQILKQPSFNLGFMLESGYNGIEKSVLFEFKSDGSFSSLGFTIIFAFLECKCNSVIKCDASLKEQTIMGNNSDERYCGNLSCNITIQPCPTDFGFMKLTILLTNDGIPINYTLFDIFRIISNNETVLKIDNSNRDLVTFGIYIKSSNRNIFEAITNPSYIPGYVWITYQPYKLPSLNTHIILSANFSNCILDLSTHILYIIEISDDFKSKNLSILIYRFQKEKIRFSIFNNQSLTYNLNGGRNCFGLNPYKCEIKNNQIALYQNDNDENGQFVAVKLSEKFDGCVLSETVITTKEADHVNVTAISNNNGICDIILFTDDDYDITYLWTTSVRQNVKVFIGLDKSRLYFEFNSISAKKWQHIVLLSRSYIIEIPKSAAIFIMLSKFSGWISLEYPYFSMITTRHFGTTKYDDQPLVYQYIGNVALKFTAVYYNMSSKDSYYFLTSDEEDNFSDKI